MAKNAIQKVESKDRTFDDKRLANKLYPCYTINMKTAISIEKNLFEDAEQFSRAAGLSRSKLYCIAIREYMQNNSPQLITETYNNYYENHESKLDDDLKMAAYKILAGEDWKILENDAGNLVSKKSLQPE